MELYFERKLSNFKFELRIEILTVNRHRIGTNDEFAGCGKDPQ